MNALNAARREAVVAQKQAVRAELDQQLAEQRGQAAALQQQMVEFFLRWNQDSFGR